MNALTDEQRALAEENVGLVYSTAYRMVEACMLPQKLLEDGICEGFLGLMKAAAWYESAKGTKFSTLAVIAIRQQIRNMVQREIAAGRLVQMSLDETIGEQSTRDAGKTWAEAMAAENDTEAEALNSTADAVCKILAEKGKEGLAQMLIANAMGKSAAEIAREHGVTRQWIHRQLSDARRMLREEMSRDE